MATASGDFVRVSSGLASRVCCRMGAVVGLNGGIAHTTRACDAHHNLVRTGMSYSTAPVDNGYSTAPLKKSAAVQQQPRPKHVTAGKGVSPERERGAGKDAFSADSPEQGRVP